MKQFFSNVNVRITMILGCFVLLAFGVWFFLFQEEGASVVITVDGEFYGAYELDRDQEIPVTVGDQTTNVVCIRDGYAYMREAKCPDHLCIHQGRIAKTGESIVCLPNRVVVTIVSDDEIAVDAVAK